MKINKKFIAIGLGVGISFTGTCMSYSWFSDNSRVTNTINIGKLVETVGDIVIKGNHVDIEDCVKQGNTCENDNEKCSHKELEFVFDIEGLELESGQKIYFTVSEKSSLLPDIDMYGKVEKDGDEHDGKYELEIETKEDGYINVNETFIKDYQDNKAHLKIKMEVKDKNGNVIRDLGNYAIQVYRKDNGNHTLLYSIVPDNVNISIIDKINKIEDKIDLTQPSTEEDTANENANTPKDEVIKEEQQPEVDLVVPEVNENINKPQDNQIDYIQEEPKNPEVEALIPQSNLDNKDINTNKQTILPVE